jgi:selenocysteine lyase/cysteine desulfurase
MSPYQPIIPFGKQFREEFFTLLDHEVTPVNHGSYGLTPTPVLNKFIECIKDENKFPDKFVKIRQQAEYIHAIQILADEVLRCDYHNLAIVDNATTAVNTILRLYPFEKGDKIVMPTTVYESCGNTVKFLQKRIGVEPVLVEIDYPLNDDDIVSKFEQVFQGTRIKLCLFDLIISNPGIRFPFERLTALCKKYGVLSLIDGAHSVGILPMNLGELKPDFYTSNLHKWLFVPRGCAILYVDSKHFSSVETMPIGHVFVDNEEALSFPPEMELIKKFKFIATKTFAQVSCIEAAINFRKNACGGESTIYKYCNELCHKVGLLITKDKWHGMSILNDGFDTVTTMINIEVPIDHLAKRENIVMDNSSPEQQAKFLHFSRKFIEEEMINKYHTFIPMFYHHGKLYARFSCQIYNDLDDYDYASDVVLKVLKSLFRSDWFIKWYNEQTRGI